LHPQVGPHIFFFEDFSQIAKGCIDILRATEQKIAKSEQETLDMRRAAMTDRSAPIMDRLISRGILTCSLCRTPLRHAGDGSFVCENAHPVALKHGVLDLYVRPLPDGGPLSADHDRGPAILSALSERLGLNYEDLLSANILEPLPSTGNVFFDAEEEVFVDRFAFSNIKPRLKIEKVYTTGKMQAGATCWLAVRIRNNSDFVVSTAGANPVVLSYHLYNSDGAVLVESGLRSALPVDIKPGQAVTAHVAVEIPSNVGRFKLKVLAVHEMVSWLEDDGVTLDIDVTAAAAADIPRRDAERPFSEALDDALAQEFLDRHLSNRQEPIIGLEIGGATMAALSKWMWASRKVGSIINCDVSIRLLRIAALLSKKGADPVTLHARFDANAMPMASDSIDVAVFSRSLHHFEDPVRVLRECRRVLRPDGLLFLLCEPVAILYDEPTKALIRSGVNEQMFPVDGYQAMIAEAGFEAADLDLDWGFSLKGAFRKAISSKPDVRSL
jgi:ubiquinone/menaquinone biosynthesis C-methylase UbiE